MNIDVIEQKIREVRGSAEFGGMPFPNPVKKHVYVGDEFNPSTAIRTAGRAIVDENTGNVFAYVTDRYQIVPHEVILSDLMHKVEPSLKKRYGKPKITASLYQNGALMVAKLQFDKAAKAVKLGDDVAPQVLIMNSLNGQWKLKTEIGMLRLVCTNGMVAVTKLGGDKRLHTTGLDMDQIEFMMKKAMAGFNHEVNRLGGWAAREISIGAYEAFEEKELPKLFSTSEIVKVNTLPIIGAAEGNGTIIEMKESDEVNLYDAFNAYTQHITHNVKSENRRLDLTMAVGRVFNKLDA